MKTEVEERLYVITPTGDEDEYAYVTLQEEDTNDERPRLTLDDANLDRCFTLEQLLALQKTIAAFLRAVKAREE